MMATRFRAMDVIINAKSKRILLAKEAQSLPPIHARVCQTIIPPLHLALRNAHASVSPALRAIQMERATLLLDTVSAKPIILRVIVQSC